MAKRQKPANAPQGRLLGLFENLVEDRGDTGLLSFNKHAGIGLLDVADPQEWWPTFQAHYTEADGSIDENRVATDLTTWGPIASRVMELKLAERPGAHG